MVEYSNIGILNPVYSCSLSTITFVVYDLRVLSFIA